MVRTSGEFAFNFLCFSSPNVCSDPSPFYRDFGNKMQNPPWDHRPSSTQLPHVSVQTSGGPGWQGPRALPGGPAAFSPLSLVQAGNMKTTGIGQGGSKHPRCPRQRRLVVSPIHARRGANKTAKLILTGDLNPILSQVPEATNQHTAFCTAVPLLLSRSKTHNPGLQRASPNYTPN